MATKAYVTQNVSKEEGIGIRDGWMAQAKIQKVETLIHNHKWHTVCIFLLG
jgi:hypothetical protein